MVAFIDTDDSKDLFNDALYDCSDAYCSMSYLKYDIINSYSNNSYYGMGEIFRYLKELYEKYRWNIFSQKIRIFLKQFTAIKILMYSNRKTNKATKKPVKFMGWKGKR